MKEPLHTDVLVLGCGIAGGTAALELAEAGLDVLIVTRAAEPQESNTYWAQGGIIFKGEGDSPELLAKDIEHTGDGLCRDQAVQLLAVAAAKKKTTKKTVTKKKKTTKKKTVKKKVTKKAPTKKTVKKAVTE